MVEPVTNTKMESLNRAINGMTQKTFEFTSRLLMVLSVVISVALIVFLEVTA